MKSILLVEDDPFIVDIYSSQLRHEGYKVDIANTGELALEKIKNNYPDLMILDIKLPKMDGWEVLKTVRAETTTQNLKVIVVSNFNKEDQRDNIVNLGVLKYLLKVEATPDDILNAVKEVLG